MQRIGATKYPQTGRAPLSFRVLAYSIPSQPTPPSPPRNFDYSAATRSHLHRALDNKLPFPVFGTKDVNRSRCLLITNRSILSLNVFPDNLVSRRTVYGHVFGKGAKWIGGILRQIGVWSLYAQAFWGFSFPYWHKLKQQRPSPGR